MFNNDNIPFSQYDSNNNNNNLMPNTHLMGGSSLGRDTPGVVGQDN